MIRLLGGKLLPPSPLFALTLELLHVTVLYSPYSQPFWIGVFSS